MKQTLFLILVLSSMVVSAQVKWKNYRSADHHLSARFPNEFQIAQSKAGDSLSWLEISAELETMIFSISVRETADPVTPVNAYYLASSALSEFILALDAQKLKDYRVKNGETEGQGAELLLLSGGNAATVRAFAKNNYIYIIYVIELHPGADSSVASRFFDGLKI